MYVGSVALIGAELDDRAILVRPEPPEGCWPQYTVAEVDALEAGDAVTVTAQFTRDPHGGCDESAPHFGPVRIELDRPLGDRRVFDGNRPGNPLRRELPPGTVSSRYRIDASDDAVQGVSRAGKGEILLWYGTEQPVSQSGWTRMAGGLSVPPALAVPIPARGGTAWFGLHRQHIGEAGVQYPPRSAMVVDVEVDIPPLDSNRLLDHELVVEIGPGAITVDGDTFDLNSDAITIRWDH